MKTNQIRTALAALAICAGLATGQVRFNVNPVRALGQLDNQHFAFNLVEGRELNSPGAVVLDTTSSPPAVYVADTGNSRVLGWRNSAAFQNGAKADIVIGQRDLLSNSPTPPSSVTSGLSYPAGLAVDAAGNLWVLDNGNNRVLRYRRPFDQTGESKEADLVVGQETLNGRLPNAGGLSAKTMSTAPTTTVIYLSSIAFDAQGNLWLSDPGNNRVLRYPAERVGPAATENGPAADLVIGQPDFTTGTAPPLAVNNANRVYKKYLLQPGVLAFDRAGRLYVGDDYSRVAVFVPPFSNNMLAERILGVEVMPSGGAAPAQFVMPPTPWRGGGTVPAAMQRASDINLGGTPRGILSVDNRILVADSINHRVLRFDPYETWPAELGPTSVNKNAYSPSAVAVIGQDDFASFKSNRKDFAEPGSATLSQPSGLAFAAGEVWIADASNHRVLAFGDLSTGPQTATGAPYDARRVLGQYDFPYNTVNLAEGKEFDAPYSAAVDTTSTPPRLYVADTLNHRVLGFADARGVRSGSRADIVIGQVDFGRTLINSPGNNPNAPTREGLFLPTGVAVDPDGNLWVADTSNGRVLRYPKPFSDPSKKQLPDLVLGQADFTSRNFLVADLAAGRQPLPSARTMLRPHSIAFTPEGNLAVSDLAYNRVLYWPKSAFANSAAATVVLGQDNFTANDTASPAAAERFSFSDRNQIAIDTSGNLYVTDGRNRRVQVFNDLNHQTNGAGASFSLKTFGIRQPNGTVTANGTFSKPVGIAVSAASGTIWVADSSAASRLQRFPRLDQLVFDTTTLQTMTLGAEMYSIALDGFDNLLIPDVGNRVALHFPEVNEVRNAASYSPSIAPGMIAMLKLQDKGPSLTDGAVAVNSEAVWPVNLADTQVLINDVPSPLYYVAAQQLAFQVPAATPLNTPVDITIVRPSTGQIFASSKIRLVAASPGFFTENQAGTGQVAAYNQDQVTKNGSSNPELRGNIISFYMTGQGLVPNMPADGQPAQGLLRTDVDPIVTFSTVTASGATAFLTPAKVEYSGLAPNLVGLWQINAIIPKDFQVTGCNVRVGVSFKSRVSTEGPTGTAGSIFTTVCIK